MISGKATTVLTTVLSTMIIIYREKKATKEAGGTISKYLNDDKECVPYDYFSVVPAHV